MELNMNRCIHCGHPGKVVVVNSVYYAQCTKCRKRDLYNYAGITRRSVIEQWNAENSEKLAPKPLTAEDFLYSRPKRAHYVYKINGKEYRTQLAVANVLHTVSSTIAINFIRAKSDTMIYNGVKVERYLVK